MDDGGDIGEDTYMRAIGRYVELHSQIELEREKCAGRKMGRHRTRG